MRITPLLAFIVAALAFLGAASPAGATPTLTPPSPSSGGHAVQIRGVDVNGFPVLAVTVSVPDPTAAKVFRVTEDGRPRPVLSVRPLLETGKEIDVILAIDTSDSVRGAPLAAAVAAAKAFVQSLPSNVPVGIITFSDQVRVLSPITSDHPALIAALGSLTVTQLGTKLYDAVVAASGLFNGSAQHNVILLTDGKDGSSEATLQSATSAAVKAHVTVYSIGIQGRTQNFPALEALSRQTGGTLSPASNVDLSALYASLANRLSRQYVLLFRSHSAAGSQVSIAVQTPAGSDTSFVLLPKVGVSGTTGSGKPLLNGNLGLAVALASSFTAVFVLFFMFLGAGARARRDRDLTRWMKAKSVSPEGEMPSRPDTPGPTAWIPRPMVQVTQAVSDIGGFTVSLDRKLDRAGLPMSAGELVATGVLAAMAGALIGGLAFRNVIFVLVIALVAAVLPFVYVSFRMSRRINALQGQLPDILMILASSMRAGHSFLQALDTVSKEVGEPAGPEFTRVVAEIRLGRRFEEAMQAMSERVRTDEFKWMVLAVNVQREVGGNLAEILDTVAETTREREVIRRQVKVLAGEGILSLRILIALPFLLTLYIVKVNPTYMRLLWTTRIGLGMIGVAVILMTIGVLWARW